MVIQSEDNSHQDLNNQDFLVIISCLTFNGSKYGKSKVSSKESECITTKVFNYEVPQNPK